MVENVGVSRRVLGCRLGSVGLLVKVVLPVELLPIRIHVERDGVARSNWLDESRSSKTANKQRGGPEKKERKTKEGKENASKLKGSDPGEW